MVSRFIALIINDAIIQIDDITYDKYTVMVDILSDSDNKSLNICRNAISKYMSAIKTTGNDHDIKYVYIFWSAKSLNELTSSNHDMLLYNIYNHGIILIKYDNTNGLLITSTVE